jgi:hypothetical protein
MAAGPWVLHDKAKLYMGDGTIDLDAHTLKVALFTNASNVATTSVDGVAAATNEVANGNGYFTGGWTVTGVTWTEAAGTVKLDSNDPNWTAASGTITAKYAALYDDSVASPVAKPIIAHMLLDTLTDVSVTDGNTLTIQLSANGYFTGT